MPDPDTVRVAEVIDLAAALASLQISVGRPVLAVVGGAGGLADGDLAAIRRVLQQQVVPIVEAWGAVVVDGGTRSGVMCLLGEARQRAVATFPLVGVAAVGTVDATGLDLTPRLGTAPEPDPAPEPRATPVAERVRLDGNHTHAVLVPGSNWGDESRWICAVTTSIANGSPSATLVVNGGDITFDDLELSIAAGRPVIVVAGTGRAADEVAAARTGSSADPRAQRIAGSPFTHLVSLDDPAGLADLLDVTLGAPARDQPPSLHDRRS